MDIEPLARVFVTTHGADEERTVAGLVTSYVGSDEDGYEITATMFPRNEQPWFYEGPVFATRDDAEDASEGHPNVAYLETPEPPAPAAKKRARKAAPAKDTPEQ